MGCHKLLYFFSSLFLLSTTVSPAFQLGGDSTDTKHFPSVLPPNHADLLEAKLKQEAKGWFAKHRLPDNQDDWEGYSENLRNKIIEKSNVFIDPGLPLNLRKLGTIDMEGYRIENIAFQTRPGVYATANLFVPEGKGPFPAVINMHAHAGRFDDNDQAVAHSLAAEGYVCLSIDPWGAGERTTVHGVKEYHGANLGASFLNIGESLLGIQIADNMRGIDLLASLPYVDAQNIGAVGASGGGNQTMWLAAVDPRVKSAVPVVSVGTFESYIMRSNCICEMMVDGLTFTEEAGVLALARAIMPVNHNLEANPTFYTSEMLRSYNNAQPVFEMLGKEEHLSCRTYDLPHGFLREDREAMLGWFDLHLKQRGTGAARAEKPFTLLEEDELMVYPKGKRDPDIVTSPEYLSQRGGSLREMYLRSGFHDPVKQRQGLSDILGIRGSRKLKEVHQYTSAGGWDRYALETNDLELIPLLHLPPTIPDKGYVILSSPEGKVAIAPEVIAEYRMKGTGIVLVDLTGTGEIASPSDSSSDKQFVFHTSSRALMWLGKTLLGEWVKDLELVVEFLKTNYQAQKISVDGRKETALAGLFLSAINGNVEHVTLRDAPLSYLFGGRETVDFYSMAIHVPRFLNWGDVSLAAALGESGVTFILPRTMSGREVRGPNLEDFRVEFVEKAEMYGKRNPVSFEP